MAYARTWPPKGVPQLVKLVLDIIDQCWYLEDWLYQPAAYRHRADVLTKRTDLPLNKLYGYYRIVDSNRLRITGLITDNQPCQKEKT